MGRLSNCLGCTIFERYKRLLLLLTHHVIKSQEHLTVQIQINLKLMTSLFNEYQKKKEKEGLYIVDQFAKIGQSEFNIHAASS